uniref:Uncharacterized protein n=1 Tax=Spongospora subterranea TaxID=70186 RepID=A0A0H5QG89_9EUKA|eukprot:CRZ01073.1 hypothetical protein [Spongospora subterranea]
MNLYTDFSSANRCVFRRISSRSLSSRSRLRKICSTLVLSTTYCGVSFSSDAFTNRSADDAFSKNRIRETSGFPDTLSCEKQRQSSSSEKPDQTTNHRRWRCASANRMCFCPSSTVSLEMDSSAHFHQILSGLYQRSSSSSPSLRFPLIQQRSLRRRRSGSGPSSCAGRTGYRCSPRRRSV